MKDVDRVFTIMNVTSSVHHDDKDRRRDVVGRFVAHSPGDDFNLDGN